MDGSGGLSAAGGAAPLLRGLQADEVYQNERGIRVTLDRGRDALLTRFGKETLKDRYLMPGESWQDLFARVAGHFADDSAHAQRLYDYISKLWFMPATPVLSNGGTKRGLPISCFLNEADDSLEGIVGLWTENVWLAARGEAGRFRLPTPMRGRKTLDFSFSGLKTALLYKLRELEAAEPLNEAGRASLALALETAIVESLLDRTARALEKTGHNRLVVAGGVGANRRLRQQLRARCDAGGVKLHYPRVEYCTDNGAMIALTGCLRLAGGAPRAEAPKPRPRWDLSEVSSFSPAPDDAA